MLVLDDVFVLVVLVLLVVLLLDELPVVLLLVVLLPEFEEELPLFVEDVVPLFPELELDWLLYILSRFPTSTLLPAILYGLKEVVTKLIVPSLL